MRMTQEREGTLPGGLPYLAIGSGEPLVFLCGSTPDHRNPRQGVERAVALRIIRPLAAAGFEVYFTNRWPDMAPGTTFAMVAERHADAIAERFGRPVAVIGHSTGGSVALQLIADRPEVVERAVVASAAYTLGPVAKRSQRKLVEALEETGRYSTEAILDGMEGVIRFHWLRRALTPVAALAARRIPIANPTDTATMLRAEDAFDVRDRLADIPTKTLVICGARDYYWTPEMFAETAFRMPHGRLIMYPDRGHAIPWRPEFARDVIGFLREDRST
jgi:pimeloyl-ACP methyl ester carboxylesterase